MAKTKEVVFHKPNTRNFLFPSELPPGIEKTSLMCQVVGYLTAGGYGHEKHVNYILHICNHNQRTYLLTQIKRQ